MLSSSFTQDMQEAGCDEAGRGCLAGPVVAAAVMFPKGYKNELLTDSKLLSKAMRTSLKVIIKNDALAWAIGEASHQEIDELNILNASFLAMHRALDQLHQQPQLILVDGNRFKSYKSIPHHCIVKGDQKYLSIAAASILAKTHRDHLMEELDKQYQGYGWSSNAGYPTKQHRAGIKLLGVSPVHRRTFRLLPTQLELF